MKSSVIGLTYIAFKVAPIKFGEEMKQGIIIDRLNERLLHPQEDLRHLTAEQQFQLIMSKVSDLTEPVITSADLEERLRHSLLNGAPLKVKFGIDPTGPDIHIGHAVSLINLRLFQRMGHKIILLIGDFTGMIGDPSGRVDARPALTAEQVRENMTSYEEQASRIIDLKDPSIERRYNTEWMNQLTMRQWVKIIKEISANSLLQREDFRLRLAAGQGLSMAELEYALFMGYDSVVLSPDIELGGIDQFLNMHMCRQMMSRAGQKPEIIISYNLLAGTTGERDEQGRFIKMSKSRGNYIPVTAHPNDMYGAVMSIPDDIMWIWFRELTEITPEELEELRASVAQAATHPKQVKQLLARVVVGAFNDFNVNLIAEAEQDFNSKFGKEAVLVPESAEVVRLRPEATMIDYLLELTLKSKGEIRRLVQQEGIRWLKDQDYVPIKMEDLSLPSELLEKQVIRVGKRFYYRFEW